MKFDLRPSSQLSIQQIDKGLQKVVYEGMTTEAMSTLTGGTFLIAMALKMGASNLQIGILAALPIFSNVFQLLAIWLVQRFNNRRLIAMIGAFIARFPLLVIGALPFLFTAGSSVKALIFLLFFHYTFNAVVGASWNAWMMDLVPEKRLGSYFSHRSRLIQILNVTMSLIVALVLDHVKLNAPEHEMLTYSVMFVAGGVLGIFGIYLLSRTPEPRSFLSNENVFKLVARPLKDKNFRKLLSFNASWAFALNIATPFFTVYMMKTLNISLSYVIGLGILSQLASIVFIKIWGKYSDKYSNKTILHICAPLYVVTILSWTLTAVPSLEGMTKLLLILINILTGIATSGINLAINNIGLKLANKEEAIVYISTKNMFVAFVSAIAPLLGGWFADTLAGETIQLTIAGKTILYLQHWNFFFIIGSILAFASLQLLKQVKEEGEADRSFVFSEMRSNVKRFRKKRLTPAIVKVLSMGRRTD